VCILCGPGCEYFVEARASDPGAASPKGAFRTNGKSSWPQSTRARPTHRAPTSGSPSTIAPASKSTLSRRKRAIARSAVLRLRRTRLFV